MSQRFTRSQISRALAYGAANMFANKVIDAMPSVWNVLMDISSMMHGDDGVDVRD